MLWETEEDMAEAKLMGPERTKMGLMLVADDVGLYQASELLTEV